MVPTICRTWVISREATRWILNPLKSGGTIVSASWASFKGVPRAGWIREESDEAVHGHPRLRCSWRGRRQDVLHDPLGRATSDVPLHAAGYAYAAP